MRRSRTAACACGQLRITVEGEPVRISICHCLDCQRRTGSAFGVQAGFPEASVRAVDGETREFVRTAESGNAVRFQFCPTCGSTVYYRLDVLPGFVGVPVGGFADPGFPSPTVAVYEARAHAWVRCAHAEAMEHGD